MNFDNKFGKSYIDENEIFFDFILQNEMIFINDYSNVNREIIVLKDNIIELGKSKFKKTISSINDLKKFLMKITEYVQQMFQKNRFYSWGVTNSPDDILCDPFNGLLYNFFVINPEYYKFFINQLAFDILFDKHIEDAPKMTLNEYCDKYVYYDWQISIIAQLKELKDEFKDVPNSEKDRKRNDFLYKESCKSILEKAKKANYNQMIEEIEREVRIKSNPALIKDVESLGIKPYAYLKYLKEKSTKKPKWVWDYIYYNGNDKLITSKQYRRIFVRDSNFSYKRFVSALNDYDRFVETTFNPEEGNNKDYFTKSMEYYYLEMYKRLDFAYKLSERLENIDINIDKDHFLVKRFHPKVASFNICEGSLYCHYKKHKYYRPLLFIEETWQKRLPDILNGKEYNPFLDDSIKLFRGKVYELFKYHYNFVSDDYEDISNFIRKDYNILAYHEKNKIWKDFEGEITPAHKKRIRHMEMINTALFGESEKRNRSDWRGY